MELAKRAGWDDNVREIETRVTTAIAALEDAGYLRRGQNMPQIFANSILSENAQEAIDNINASEKFDQRQKEQAVRIIKKLFSSKNRKMNPDDVGESRVDYISDHLGIVRDDVIKTITLLRDEKILADTKDLTAYIRRGENINRSLNIVESFLRIENFLFPLVNEEESVFHLKELNEKAEAAGCADVDIQKIKTILNFWTIKNWIKKKNHKYSKNHLAVLLTQSAESLHEKIEKRQRLARFVVEYLFGKVNGSGQTTDDGNEEMLVEFSVHELKDEFERRMTLFDVKVSLDDIEDTLFFLSRIDALKIEGGFLVIYNRLTIERLEKDNKIRYKADDYQKLNQFYENKIQQIHIVGEYAKKMISDYQEALQFVEDYFHLNYQSFLNKYFKGSRQGEIKRNVTPSKFKQLFGELSPAQLKIITDKESNYIAVAAGPGSGKTRVLVHKLASLLLMEDVKHEQLLMLTFSRAAATEFKKRLLKLVGNAAHFVDIKTFHSYCFDLLGKVGSLEKSDEILQSTVARIKSGTVDVSRITKAVLVIDEAQDMNADEFDLVLTLMDHNEEMRVIVVGDDDQNIYEFRGSDSKYMIQFINQQNATLHELLDNYRSKLNLVQFSNWVGGRISHRLKETPINAVQHDSGRIKLVRYRNGNLVAPLVNDIISADLTGTTCVLTKSNKEASEITGLLIRHGLQAKLIQSNDGFNLYNLREIRYFVELVNTDAEAKVIYDDLWEQSKRELAHTFSNSPIREVVQNLLREFEKVNNKKKYKSDLETFIRESKIEDFYNAAGETIFVSTIHKAKGKEFDNVFLMLENFDYSTDKCMRQLYVAITRAKQNLTIHLNSNFFDAWKNSDLKWIEDHEHHLPPDEIAMQLTHKDLYLDYFINKQLAIRPLMSGDQLNIQGLDCTDVNGKPVLRFSNRFAEEIERMKKHNYQTQSAKVNFIIQWQKEELEQECLIVLPEIVFRKNV